MNAPITDLRRSASDELYALLAVVADPAKHKARLDELNAAEASAKERLAEADSREAETRRLHNTAAATNIVADNRVKAIEVREKEQDDREAEQDKREAKLQTAEARQSEAGRAAVEAQKEANKREAERLAVMRKDLEAQSAKFKTFSSSL